MQEHEATQAVPAAREAPGRAAVRSLSPKRAATVGEGVAPMMALPPQVLALQATVGNATVCRFLRARTAMVQRQPQRGAAAPGTTPPGTAPPGPAAGAASSPGTQEIVRLLNASPTQGPAIVQSLCAAVPVQAPPGGMTVRLPPPLPAVVVLSSEIPALLALAGRVRTPQQVATLVEDITQAIAQKETGRRAVESGLPTSSGTRASYASQVQATAGWTISALLGLDDARLAGFRLTRAELRSANARAVQAGELWDAVMASPATATGASLAAAQTARLGGSGLTAAEVGRMALFRDVRNDLRTRLTTERPQREQALRAMAPPEVWALATPAERARVGAPTAAAMTDRRRAQLAPAIARREAVATVAAATPATTLGFPGPTLNTYFQPSGVQNWGEDRAAWQRVAVGREPPGGPGDVGARIEAATTADGGLSLGRARIAHITEHYLAAHPLATDDEVCRNAAVSHNPHNPLTDEVLGHFHRFHTPRPAQPACPPQPAPAPAPAPAAPAPTGPAPAPAPPAPTGEAEVPDDGTRLADAGTAQPPAPEPAAAQPQAPAPISEEEVLAQLGVHDPEPTDTGQAGTSADIRTA